MNRASYRERDHAFGQSILNLRSAIGFTQAEMAKFLGVSRRAVGGWEAGNSYPKADHLQSLIALAFKHRAFQADSAATEIRALWQASRQKITLNETWLAALLSTPPAIPNEASALPPAQVMTGPQLDWNDAPAVPLFYGREWELNLLTQWVIDERCRVVSVLGLGGIGKSTLAARLMHQVAGHFDVVIWQSLRDAPACESLLEACLKILTPQSLVGTSSVSLEWYLGLLLEHMRKSRVLLVLDNMEVLLEEGTGSGHLRPGFESYGRLLHQMTEATHQSCVLLTSREKPADLVSHEGNRSLVRTLRLARLNAEACEQLLSEKEVTGDLAQRRRLIDAYDGNPLALKIVTQTIVEIFDRAIAPFLEQGEIIFGGVRKLFDEQFKRLSALEQCVLLWLATLREPATLDELMQVLAMPVSRARLLETIAALHRRSLIEPGQKQGSFALHSVILEYATSRLITDLAEEINSGSLVRLIGQGIELAQSREYVRQNQTRLLVTPLLALLRFTSSSASALEAHLVHLLDSLRARTTPDDGLSYAPANLIALLRQLRGDLRGLDLSRLSLRNVFLQGVAMQRATLAGSLLVDSTFTAAVDSIQSIAVSPNGRYWAAGAANGEVHVWRDEGRVSHLLLHAHSNQVEALAFSPDGLTLATGSWDCQIKLWDVESGALIATLHGHEDYVQDLVFHPNGRLLVSGSDDLTIRVWELPAGSCTHVLRGHTENVYGVAFNPAGTMLASAGFDRTICLWDTSNWMLGRTLIGHASRVTKVRFSPDGTQLASGGYDHLVKLWDVERGECTATLMGHTGAVTDLAWSHTGSYLASCGFDARVCVWQIGPEHGPDPRPDPLQHRVLTGHASTVYALRFTPDGASLLTGGNDRSLRVWDVASGQCQRIVQGYAVAFHDVAWCAERVQGNPGGRLVSGSSDGMLTLWDMPSGLPAHTLHGHVGAVFAVACSPDGRWIASAGHDQVIRVWRATTRHCVHVLRGHTGTVHGLAWSPDSSVLASVGMDHTVRTWEINPQTGQVRWIGQAHTARVNRVSWHPNGTQLATCGEDQTVRLWRAEDGTELQVLRAEQPAVAAVKFSPDGSMLALSGGGGRSAELSLWDPASGQRLRTLIGHESVVFALAWSLDGLYLVSGSSNGSLRWWQASGDCVHRQEAHVGWVRAIDISPGGDAVASAAEDGVIRLWDQQSGVLLQELRPDRPYERLNITGIRGLTDVQMATLRALGAVEDNG